MSRLSAPGRFWAAARCPSPICDAVWRAAQRSRATHLPEKRTHGRNSLEVRACRLVAVALRCERVLVRQPAPGPVAPGAGGWLGVTGYCSEVQRLQERSRKTWKSLWPAPSATEIRR